MRIHNFCLLTLLLFTNCTSTNKKEDEAGVSKIDSSTLKITERKVFSDQLKSKLKGIWTDGSSENATFSITSDSIVYVDQFTSYKYELYADTIQIEYPEMVYIGKIYFSKDTFVLESKGEIVKYWKFKN
jgi:hypothetical protein